MKFLEKINFPADFKSLKVKQLPQLCHEILEFIIEEKSQSPEHAGSILGAVELAVAVHYVFDTHYADPGLRPKGLCAQDPHRPLCKNARQPHV